MNLQPDLFLNEFLFALFIKNYQARNQLIYTNLIGNFEYKAYCTFLVEYK